MQFNITFNVTQPGQLLPLSYQYELSSWLYSRISDADQEFGRFLHAQGYTDEKKRFKFFTFSNLHVPQYEILKDRMLIKSREIHLMVSFLIPEVAQQMIMGIFKEQKLKLGDRISQVELNVSGVEMLPLPEIQAPNAILGAVSPIFISGPIKVGDKLRHQYFHPQDDAYEAYFFQNLMAKYKAAISHGLIAPIQDDQYNTQLKVLSKKIRKRGITIKAFTPQETKVIGYQYDFEIHAHPILIRLGLLAGFGGHNAMGFGACRYIGKRK